MACAKIL